jgi:(1->4)-alpha-D-glucan 1-alpha-D-glucosylmutase
VVIAPRLVAGLLPEAEQAPIGQAIWGDTRVVLPDAFAGLALQQLFTGARVNVIRATGQSVLPLATTLAEFPVALLHTSGLE